MASTRDFMAVHIRSVTGTIGTNPLAQFADWKLAGDEAGLKVEVYLLQNELIRKDAFPYQSVVIILDRRIRIMTHYGMSAAPLSGSIGPTCCDAQSVSETGY
jgi:hypothetical protein